MEEATRLGPDQRTQTIRQMSEQTFEVVYAASHEGALHLDDILERRTHIAIETRDAGMEASQRVAELAGEVLRWDDVHCEQEIANYAKMIKADRLATKELIDENAIKTRNSVL